MINPDRRALLVLIDAVLAMAIFLVALRYRFGGAFRTVWEASLGLPNLWIFVPALGLTTVAVFWISGVYRPEAHWSLRNEIEDVFRAIAIGALLILSLLFWFKFEDVSRISLIGFFTGLAAGTLAVRFAIRYWFTAAPDVRVLIVGGSDVGRLTAVSGLTIVGGLSISADIGVPLLGEIEDLSGVLSREVIDEVIVCLPTHRWNLLDDIAAVCQEQGKTMRVPVDIVRHTLRHSRVEDVGEIPMLSVVTTPQDFAALVSKRVVDLVGAAFGMVFALAAGVVVVPVLLMTQGRPLFFSQLRGGLNGRPFTVYKFRTMINGADAAKAALADRNERAGPAFKVTDDPRVTAVGRWLRKTSFDEVPQLWNVLRGEMSLVGPRPQPIEEVREYDAWHRRRLSVKPGVTGLWQVTARADPSFDRWVDLDLEYIDTWSLWADMMILAKTPLALVRSPGE